LALGKHRGRFNELRQIVILRWTNLAFVGFEMIDVFDPVRIYLSGNISLEGLSAPRVVVRNRKALMRVSAAGM
jgi:hypothetical protein